MSDQKQPTERRFTEAEVNKRITEARDEILRGTPQIKAEIGIGGFPAKVPSLTITITGGDYAVLRAIGDALVRRALDDFMKLATTAPDAVPGMNQKDPS